MKARSSPGRVDGGRCRRRCYRIGFDPAGMDPCVKGVVVVLAIEGPLTDQAPVGRLNVVRRAGKAVIEGEMPEGRIEIVPPQETDRGAAEPDAFRVAGG